MTQTVLPPGFDPDLALDFAHDLADAARDITLRWFRQPLEIDEKPDLSPVTCADRDCEHLLRARIRARWPDHGILGEEHGREGLDRDWIWVLDPIDGTKSFISGNPLWGTMICLMYRGVALLSLVDVPITRERWVMQANRGCTLNDAPIQCRTERSLAQATVYTTSLDAFDHAGRVGFEAVSSRARLRRFGGDCYAYGLLAAGHVDIVFGAALEPYDFLPLGALVEGAGGVVTDWAGNRPTADMGNVRIVACASPALHREVLARLAATA